MADGYALSLGKALIDWLRADAGVSGLVSNRIYDEPPQSAARPFVRINDIEPRPLRADCVTASNIVFSLEAHSRPNSGRVEATRCAEAVVAALDSQDIPVEGHNLTKLHWITQTVSQDDDGEGYTAIIVFDCILEVT